MRISFWLVLFVAPMLTGCSDGLAPRDSEEGDSLSPPAATTAVSADTVRVSPGVSVKVPLDASAAGPGRVTARLIVPPIAGQAAIRDPGLLTYVSAEGAYGEDVLSYELASAGSEPVFGTIVFLISPVPDRPAGIRIIREAAVPSEPLPERIRYQGVDLTDPRIRALKPLVAEILASYAPANSALDSARVLRDWLARTAVHPYPPFHLDGSTANLSVLPPGASWADVNALYSERLEGDSNYWAQLYQDGPQMLDRLLGAQGGTPEAVDGMMERVGPARYRIRSLDDYRFVLCSYQSQMLIALWAAAGLQGMMIPTLGHDASVVFIADLSKWVYMDPTYNDEYVVAGSSTPLSPLELVTYTATGYLGKLQSRSISGPRWDAEPYITAQSDHAASYLGEHPAGFQFIGSQLNNAVTSPFGVPVRNVQLDNSAVANDPFFGNLGNFARVIPSVAFPDLGVGISAAEPVDGGALVHLVSSVPGHVRFERRAGGERAWQECEAADFVRRGSGYVEYRSVDATGATGMTALIEG